MMISTRGRYALRLMIDIARQGEAGALVTMRQAAEREDLSVKYLEQLGGALVKAGVLKSVRGVSGGIGAWPSISGVGSTRPSRITWTT